MPNTYQLMLNMHDQGGNFIANVFHYSLSEGGSGTPFDYAKALIAKWQTSVRHDFLGMIGTDILLDFITAKRVSGTGGPSAQAIDGTTGGGTGLADAAGLAADIQWQTASVTNRPGHTFVAPVSSGDYAGGSWQGPLAGKAAVFIVTAMTQMTLTGALGTADFGIFTRKTKTFNIVKSGQLLPKPTMLNKRTKPVI